MVAEATWFRHNELRKRPRKNGRNCTQTGRDPSPDVESGPSRGLNVRESSDDEDPNGIDNRAPRLDQVRALC